LYYWHPNPLHDRACTLGLEYDVAQGLGEMDILRCLILCLFFGFCIFHRPMIFALSLKIGKIGHS